jgi:hypothetical protein
MTPFKYPRKSEISLEREKEKRRWTNKEAEREREFRDKP